MGGKAQRILKRFDRTGFRAPETFARADGRLFHASPECPPWAHAGLTMPDVLLAAKLFEWAKFVDTS